MNDLGFLQIEGTIGETFNDSYKVGNQIPKEYAFDPVDERVNIYSTYSDNLYNQFIEEGLKIFQKYNKDGKCNSKNKKLLFHTKTCEKIGKIEYQHGGYKYKENNEWNINECESYYCDMGYYYNYHEKKCVKDCVYNKTSKGLFIYDKETNKEIDIQKDLEYTFYLRNYPYDYYFAFEASENYINDYARIFFEESGEDVIIETDKNAKSDYKIKIKAINRNINPDLEFLI